MDTMDNPRGQVRLEIFGREYLENHIFCDDVAIISITDPGSPDADIQPPNGKQFILRLKVSDIEESGVCRRIYEGETIKFNDEMAKSILDFVERYRGEVNRIVCQCEMGYSRSAGVAAAIAMLYGGPEAANRIFRDRRYSPNTLIYNTLINYKHKDKNVGEEVQVHGDGSDGAAS